MPKVCPIGHQCARTLICQFSVYFEHPKYTENFHFAPKLRRFVSVSFEEAFVRDMMERATVYYFRFLCTQTSDFKRYDDVTRGTSMGCRLFLQRIPLSSNSKQT